MLTRRMADIVRGVELGLVMGVGMRDIILVCFAGSDWLDRSRWPILTDAGKHAETTVRSSIYIFYLNARDSTLSLA